MKKIYKNKLALVGVPGLILLFVFGLTLTHTPHKHHKYASGKVSSRQSARMPNSLTKVTRAVNGMHSCV